MERIKELWLSPATVLAAAALLVACASLAVALGDRATATSAELSKVGKVKVVTKSASVPAGQSGGPTATCKGKTKAISGGFHFSPPPVEALSLQQSRQINDKKSWVVEIRNNTGAPVTVFATAYCVK